MLEQRKTPRVISPVMAAILASFMPKYEPPKVGTISDEKTNVANGDAVLLPKMIVHGQRPPKLTERDIYTQKALAALAVKRYLSDFDANVLNAVNLPLFGGVPKEARAMMLYREAERAVRIHDLKDTADAFRDAGDAEAAKEVEELSGATFMREPDWHESLPSGHRNWTDYFSRH
jgi:hypothetical protein